MIISPSNNQVCGINYEITINNNKIERIGRNCNEVSLKMLGIHLDDNLSWKPHINVVNNKISKTMFALKQAKHTLSSECLLNLYKALIQPHLTHGIHIWGASKHSNLTKTRLL